MVGIIVLIMGIILIPPTQEAATIATNATNLNCTDPNLAAENVATCTAIDIGWFWFIATFVGLSVAYVSGKRTLENIAAAIFVFVIIVVAITPLKAFITLARSATYLNCSATSIIGAKMLCLFVDIWLFYFVVLVIASAITLIFAKKVAPRLGL